MRGRNYVVRFFLVVFALVMAVASVASAADAWEVLGEITMRGGANVRAEASEKAEQIGHASKGQTFDVIDINWDNGWYGIELEDGQIGYVAPGMAKYTPVSDEKSAPMLVQADKDDPLREGLPFLGTIETRGSAYVREGGGEVFPIVGRVGKGQQFDAVEVDEATGWYGIMRKDGTMVYIASKMVKFTPVPTVAVAADVQASMEILGTATLRGGANFREGPNQAYAEVGKGRSGQVYNVVEIDSKAGWYGIVMEDGTIAYVSSKMVRFAPATDMDILPGIAQAARDSEFMADKTILGQITTKGAAYVRDSGSELGLAVGETKTGQKFDVIEIDEKTGWYGFMSSDGNMCYIAPKMCTYVEAK